MRVHHIWELPRLSMPHDALLPASDARPFSQLHIIFVMGLPHSGTTLVTDFLQRHPEVAGVLESHKQSDIGAEIMEFGPNGSLHYGGAVNCLEGMCGAAANSYVSRADQDSHRWDCIGYAQGAQQMAGSRLRTAADRLIFVAKHPALLLRSALLAESCATHDVKTSFVEVSYSSVQWEGPESKYNYSCTENCRAAIISNTARCYDSALQYWAPRTHTVHFEAFGHAATWRDLELALELRPVEVLIRDGFPHLSFGSRELHNSSSSFTVYTGYLQRRCTSGPAFPNHALPM